jgi:hypothetical protein
LLPLLIFAFIQGVLLIDVTLHDPRVGYDVWQHLTYVARLSKFEFPGPRETHEFFSPPLPYVVPAVAEAEGLSYWWAAKAGQFANLAYSIGLCICVLKICDLISPGSVLLQFWSLALLSIIPVYYKSFSMVRGEPLLSFLAVASVYCAMRAYRKTPRRPRDFAVLGVLLGLAILSRQWAFFLFPALAIYAVTLPAPSLTGRMFNLMPLVLAFAIASVVGGWFYLNLHHRFGRVTAFNQPQPRWSLANEGARFYFGLGLKSVFSDPISPAFANELIPTFYSEFWGDYECYFVIYGSRGYGNFFQGSELVDLLKNDPSLKTFESNRFRIARWLGLAQAAAIVPSALFVAGVIMGIAALFGRGNGDRADGLLALVVVTSMVGYLWFLIGFPSPTGNTIKATYMLQIVPLLAILGARMLLSIRDRSPTSYKVIVGFVALSAILNAPLLFTRYVFLPW